MIGLAEPYVIRDERLQEHALEGLGLGVRALFLNRRSLPLCDNADGGEMEAQIICNLLELL